MISYIKGKVIFSDSESICIYSNGVGWNINIFDPLKYIEGNEYEVFCYMHFTQDHSSLWGVCSLEELTFLKKLITVSGVGPKIATLLIGTKGMENLKAAIENGDIQSLKVKGLGEKTIQKIIIELKGKLVFSSIGKINYTGKLLDILEGLINMGYAKSEIEKFFSKQSNDFLADSDEKDIIKEFLKQR